MVWDTIRLVRITRDLASVCTGHPPATRRVFPRPPHKSQSPLLCLGYALHRPWLGGRKSPPLCGPLLLPPRTGAFTATVGSIARRDWEPSLVGSSASRCAVPAPPRCYWLSSSTRSAAIVDPPNDRAKVATDAVRLGAGAQLVEDPDP
jgi:hypothetical protein